MEERLQKRIAESGYTSRRNAEKLIQEGKVLVKKPKYQPSTDSSSTDSPY